MFFVEWEQKYVISCISNLSISIITKPVTELRHYRGVGLQKRKKTDASIKIGTSAFFLSEGWKVAFQSIIKGRDNMFSCLLRGC